MARRRSRGGGPSKGKGLLLIGLVVLLVMGTAPPVLSFDSATVERQSSINVTNDGDAVVGLVTTDQLTAGTEGPLVNTTNAVGSSVTVTLTLQNPSKGTLRNETAEGDELQFGLGTGVTENVSIDLNCDASVDDRIEYRTEVTAPSFRGDLTRSATVDDSACSSRELVFVNANGLASVTNSTTITEYATPVPDHIGPKRADVGGDEQKEILFTDGGDVNVTDDNDKIRNLASGAIKGGSQSNLWAGEFNDSENAVYFTNPNGDLKRVNAGGTVESVNVTGGPIIIGGLGDVDPNAPNEELVVYNGNELAYKTTSGSGSKIEKGPGDRDAIGQPANFDGDGTARVPYVDGSGKLILANMTSGKTVKLEPSDVQKAPMASVDYDTDGLPEIIYVDSVSEQLKYLDGLENGPSNARVVNVTDGNDEVVTVDDGGDSGPGVA